MAGLSALIALAFLAISGTTVNPIRLQATSTVRPQAVRTYAHIATVNLSEVLPAPPGAPDLEVRLIAVEGGILLPSDLRVD